MVTEAFSISRSDLRSPVSSTTLITGGSSGIGLQTALLLHSISETNNIIILDRQSPRDVPQSIINSSRFLFQQCDLTSWSSQRAAFEEGVKKFGSIDNVFVNAGIAEYQDQFFKDELDEAGLLKEPDRRVIEIDVNAANDTTKLAIYHMRHRKDGRTGGSIVMTASLAGYLASAGAPLYSAAKHGTSNPFYPYIVTDMRQASLVLCEL
jgi:NAD(P)-dependent dehydrogenase (short-subunit alcohol dehydrogenase family)